MRQEREPGLERAGAEDVLQVERAQEERPEQHGRDREHHQRAAADAAVGEALDAQERLRGAQLEHGERGEAGERRGHRGRASAPRPSPRCRPARRRTRARRGSASPAPRRGGRARASAGGRASAGTTTCSAPAASASPTGRLMRKIRRQSTSSVSAPPSRTPKAAPAPPTAPQAPSALARSPPWVKAAMMIESAAGESIAAPRPWPARAANSVGGAAGQRRGERGEREHAQAGEEHAPAAEQVGGAAAEQQQAAEDERVARDRPADVGAADAEVLGHVGQRDVHGGDVEDDHQLGDAQQDEQPEPRAVVGRGGRVAVAGVHGGLRFLSQTIVSALENQTARV